MIELTAQERYWTRSQDDIRLEIRQRIDRETTYVMALCNAMDRSKADVVEFLKARIEANDHIIKILGRYLASKGCEWEAYYAATSSKPEEQK